MARATETTVDGSPNRKRLVLYLIDDSGDRTTAPLDIDAAESDANIEAMVEAYSDATNAYIYAVSVEELYQGLPDASQAQDGEQNSVYDVVNILYKGLPSTKPQTLKLVAPVEGIMDGDTDNVNTSAALYTALRDAAEEILIAEYEPVSVRYVERREINSRRLPA